MARNEGHVVSKRKELVPDAGDQLPVVSAGKIRTADRSLEEDVADPCYSLPGVIEDDVAGRVAGAMQYLEFQITHHH